MPRVAMQELKAFGVRLLRARGVDEATARYTADIAVTTEAAGIHTHGVVIFSSYDHLLDTGLDPATPPEIVRDRGAVALIDTRHAMSHKAMMLAADMAGRKARQHGIAMIAVRNGNWIGGLGAFVLPLVQQGFFAQLWAQSTGGLNSAPYGGIDARFSTNPLAIGFPAPDGPIVADFSTSIMSMGKVQTLINQGRRASEPVFFDKHGQVTDDPSVMTDGGAMFTLGGEFNGFKGYALALWVEALTAMAGASCNNPQAESRQNFNLMLIDPEAFEGMDYYRKEIARLIQYVKSSRLRPGVAEIRLPGEGMRRQIAQSERHGVEISDEMLNKLNALAAKNTLPPLQVIP